MVHCFANAPYECDQTCYCGVTDAADCPENRVSSWGVPRGRHGRLILERCLGGSAVFSTGGIIGAMVQRTAMNLWVLCVVVLFVGVEGMQWLGQFPLPSPMDFSQPWMILAGVGLAIASTRSLRREALPSDQSQEPPKVDSSAPAPAQPPAQPAVAPWSPPVSTRRSKVKAPGAAPISFEIRKPKGT